MKTFIIGKDRSLKLGKNNDGLIIREKGSRKAAVFTSARWASFRLCLDEIDNQLYRLSFVCIFADCGKNTPTQL